jgi:23S rRNA (guanosine2251-2'-O)-methyltransferase
MPDRSKDRPKPPSRPGQNRPGQKPGTGHPGGKSGTTHEQRDRRERFERARRDSLRPDDLSVLYGWHTVKAAL